ncbi:MAG TPA: divalent-cation tolerance protein CutA [Pseudobdellovibrionaceae bacterium]|nr:divalent-cation tolerance protein CutA [Pseudobdellovibrionaceae bacterium]
MSDVLMVYVTTPTKEVADRISETLLQENLVACTNLIPGMESRYRWRGKIEISQEFVLFLKTDRRHFDRIRERVATLHPYEVPCIVAWPLTHGHRPYLQWLKGSL